MIRCFKRIRLSFLLAFITSSIPMVSLAVSIDETFDSDLGEGRYSVHNDSTESIFAFVVGNNSAVFADGGQFNQNVPSPDVWNWEIISREDWESGESFFGFGAGNAWTVPDTSSLDWDSIFGTGVFQTVGYWVLEDPLELGILGASTPISPGETRSHFTFEADSPASPFIAFGQSGNTVDQGETHVVPVPAAAWLFVSGVLCLMGAARKARA